MTLSMSSEAKELYESVTLKSSTGVAEFANFPLWEQIRQLSVHRQKDLQIIRIQ